MNTKSLLSTCLTGALCLAGLLQGRVARAGDLTVDNLTVVTNLTVNGVIVGNVGTYYGEFVPTNGAGWYRIFGCDNDISSNIRIDSTYSGGHSDIEFSFSYVAGQADPERAGDIQVVRRLNYGVGPVSKIRLSSGTEAGYGRAWLDIYVVDEGASPGVIKLYGTGRLGWGVFRTPPTFNDPPLALSCTTLDLFAQESGRGGLLTSGIVSQQAYPFVANLASDTSAAKLKLGLITNGDAGLALAYATNGNTIDTRNLNLDIKSAYSTNAAIHVQAANNYVGIGTNTPAQMLHVSGNIKAEGVFMGNGSGLTSLSASALSGTLSSTTLPTSGVWDSTGVVISNATVKGNSATISNLTVQGPAVLNSNLTVNGLLVGDSAKYYGEFTPTNGSGWYRIVQSEAGWWAGGTMRIKTSFDNAVTDLEFNYSVSWKSDDIQVIRRLYYGNGPVQQIRLSRGDAGGSFLDIYVQVIATPAPVKLYGGGPLSGFSLANPPPFNPTLSTNRFTTLNLYAPGSEDQRGGFLTSGLVSQQSQPYKANLASDTNAARIKLGLISNGDAGLALTYATNGNVIDTRNLNLDINSAYSTNAAVHVQASNNFVGIGTNAPAQALHVAGSIKAEGYLYGFVKPQGDLTMGSFTNGLPQ